MVVWACMVAGSALAADRHYGPGNNAVGNWSANNWYTAQTGGTLTNAPGINDRAVILNGDQVHLDIDPVIADLLLSTSGGSQSARLTNSSPARLLTVTNRITLQTAFGSTALLDLNGGTVTTRTLRLQAATGGTAGHGSFTVRTGTGILYVADALDVVSSTNFSSGASTFTINSLAGRIQVGGDLSTTGFSAAALAAGSKVNWQFDDSASAFGRLVVGGAADFTNSTFLVEAETFTGAVGAYPIVTVGTWTRGFNSYDIRTTSSTYTVSLGELLTNDTRHYSLDLAGATLFLNLYNAPTNTQRDYGPGNAAVGLWTSNNWYDAQTGGLLVTPPTTSSTVRITTGDQVTFDTTTAVDLLTLSTGGGSQQTRLTYDGATRSMYVVTRLTLQNVFGASSLMDLNGGGLTTLTFRVQAGFGTTSGNGVSTFRTGTGGVLRVLGNVEATSGSNVTTSRFDLALYAGTMMVQSNVSTAGFSDPDPHVYWIFGHNGSTFGSVSASGFVNFTNSSLQADVAGYAGSASTQVLVFAGSWSNGFRRYEIKTAAGTFTTDLDRVVSDRVYDYRLSQSGSSLRLIITVRPTLSGRSVMAFYPFNGGSAASEDTYLGSTASDFTDTKDYIGVSAEYFNGFHLAYNSVSNLVALDNFPAVIANSQYFGEFTITPDSSRRLYLDRLSFRYGGAANATASFGALFQIRSSADSYATVLGTTPLTSIPSSSFPTNTPSYYALDLSTNALLQGVASPLTFRIYGIFTNQSGFAPLPEYLNISLRIDDVIVEGVSSAPLSLDTLAEYGFASGGTNSTDTNVFSAASVVSPSHSYIGPSPGDENYQFSACNGGTAVYATNLAQAVSLGRYLQFRLNADTNLVLALAKLQFNYGGSAPAGASYDAAFEIRHSGDGYASTLGTTPSVNIPSGSSSTYLPGAYTLDLNQLNTSWQGQTQIIFRIYGAFLNPSGLSCPGSASLRIDNIRVVGQAVDSSQISLVVPAFTWITLTILGVVTAAAFYRAHRARARSA